MRLFIAVNRALRVLSVMAEDLPPPAKKGRAGRAAPVAKITAKERVKQFPTELYEDSGILFCSFCDHSLDFIHLDTALVWQGQFNLPSELR